MARKRIKKFSALVGMITVTALLMLYFLAVPAFWGTLSGQIFSCLWLTLALVMLTAFGQKVFAAKRKRLFTPAYVWRGTAQTVAKQGQVSGAKAKGSS